ncbi:MAG: N-6 DNA methylase, partial [Flavobacterium sp.]|uniref:HsdM family class I SAM-dependent methyltransferase n=1 Tax=Flavobacterium sp. TaxID=239 RepID=UPI0026357C6E
MNNLSDITNWKKNFGLLPILLNPIIQDNKYLMLNGGSGDFCLQTKSNGADINTLFNIAWSSNTKNFIVIENENLKILNWLDRNKSEEIPLNKIETNSSEFYNYLISKSYKTQSDVVPFVLDIFRQLRNISRESENPSVALNILFQLLISIEEDYTKIDYTKWGIQKIDLPYQFDYFVDLIKQGVKSIHPNLDLILRHSAGALFQEAHREVIYFNPQLELFGASNKLATRNDAYSSIHYTPQYLARTIVENSLKEIDLKKTNLIIFDPSCGSSEFLIEALKQLKNFGYKGKVKVIGWDSSESAVNTSNFLLQYEKRTQWNNTDLEFEIKRVEDSLTQQWANDYDLILMNPPFVSWELLKSKDSRDAILETLGSNSRNGKPNQASAFFYKAIQSLGNDGVIGCVLPSSIFTFDSYSKMRNEIKEQIHIKTVAKLGNFVFEDALTDVSFFIGKKSNTQDPTKLIWCKNEKGIAQESLRELRKINANNQQSVEEKSFSIYSPSNFPVIKESWKVIS